MNSPRQTILIVDDTPANIKLLVGALSTDYELCVATNGLECLEAVQSTKPDLILLDIMMPYMDGYETCRHLKSSTKISKIPVIFLTAKTDSADESLGLELGAVDYIKKPFNINIVKTRIKNHIELKLYRDNLEEMVKQRTEQLVHADRLATMGTFSAGIAHEINNPNTFIVGNVQTLKLFWQLAEPILENNKDQDPTGKIEKIIPEICNIFDGILNGSERISTIINSLKTYSRQGNTSQKDPVLLSEPIQDAVTLLKAKVSSVQITTEIPPEIEIMCNSQKISQVFVNLINNAYDAVGENGEIKISAFTENEMAIISVEDNGSGMSQDIMNKIFTPFFTTKSKTNGTGLGLSIIQGIIEEHKGSISVSARSRNDLQSFFATSSKQLILNQKSA